MGQVEKENRRRSNILANNFCRKCESDNQESDEVRSKCGENGTKKATGLLVIGLILGVLLASFIVYKVADISKAKSKARLKICKDNLRIISGHINTFRIDMSRYPSNLKEFYPNNFREMPLCPAAKRDTYSSSYKLDQSKESYVLYCSGHNHKDCGLKENFPQFYSGYDIVEKP
jgi:hypothetical protein